MGTEMAETDCLEDAMLLALKMKQGARTQGTQVALEAQKGRDTDSPLSLHEECSPASTLILAQGIHIRLGASGTVQ